MPSDVPPPLHATPALASPELERTRSRAARVSMIVAASLAALKAAVAIWTGSLAIIASCLDSLLDLLASSVNFVAVRTAEAPPDKEHPFGHGKAEYLGGLVQGIVIGLSGLYILGEAMMRLRQPAAIQHTLGGVVMMALGVISSAWLVRFLRGVARTTDSPALHADSVHYLTDVYTNGGTLVALAAVMWTRSTVPDTLAAFLIAAMVLYSGFGVLRDSVRGLMDQQLPDEQIANIRAILSNHPEVVGIHDLRARQAGADKFVQLHVEMNGTLSFEAAHAIAEELTSKIEQLLGKAVVTVHADPVRLDEDNRVVSRPPGEPPLMSPRESP